MAATAVKQEVEAKTEVEGLTQKRASDLFVRALENEGVKFIFGLPGEENLDVLDSIRRSSIKLIVCKHEQAAGFMAAAYGRLTGKTGVCMSTLGPGATNFTTCAAYAHLGGYPMMMITGQKPIRYSKQGSFQIVDIVEMMHPLTKYTKQVADAGLIPSMVRKAIKIAEDEKPGPVHLEIPEDIAGSEIVGEVHEVHPVRRPIAEHKAVQRAVDMIHHAHRPLLCLGGGANRKRTSRALGQFVDELRIPFMTTQQAESADLIINVGHDNTEKPPFFMHMHEHMKVIHINFYPSQPDEVYFPQCDVVGDIANTVWQIKEKLKTRMNNWDFTYYVKCKDYIDENMKLKLHADDYPFTPQKVIEAIRSVLPENGITCLDNGMYKVWFARTFKCYQQNTLLLDNALATMGAGLPSAIAAKVTCPEKKVVAVCGDGGFAMNAQELATAVEHGIDLTCIVLNDNAYGMIEWKQHTAGYPKWGLGIVNPNLQELAHSYGAIGHKVKSAGELDSVLKDAIWSPGLHVVEIPVSYEISTQILGPILAERVKELRSLKEKPVYAEKPLVLNDEGFNETPYQTPAPSPFVSSGVAPPEKWKWDEPAEGRPESEVSESPAPSARAAPAVDTVSESLDTPVIHPKTPEPVIETPEPETPKGVSTDGARKFPYYVANKPVYENEDLKVIDKATGEVYAVCSRADPTVVDKAIAAAVKASQGMAQMPSYKRKAVLERAIAEMRERFDELALALCAEAGKPIRDARGEVTRLIDTFSIAAEESVRIYGEWSPLDISPRVEGFQSIVRRFPIGPISMVSPFNFPLNLAAHKIAPAIACGCPFVMKPASRTPIGALIIADILSKAPELPEGAFSVVPCTRDSADLFTTDPRFKMLSFTGSPEVGWNMKSRAGKKKVTLELGGNAACIIEDFTTGLDDVVKSLVHGAFYQSGQSCISVQRILVRKELRDQLRDALVAAASQLKIGDPRDEETFIGPMIDVKEAVRIEGWVNEAKERGAKVLCGGTRADQFYPATILEDVPHDCQAYSNEVFGPVACLETYLNFKDAVDMVNNSKFGLQAGIFAEDLRKCFYGFENIEAGGVVINEVPSVRVDSQPYGGVKDSGLGREGIRYAIEDMTEPRVMVLKNPSKLA